MGWKGQEFDWKQYYSVEVLAAGIKKYNDRMIKICKSRGVEYIDLAELLPRNTQTFYDDVHFNENGSRMVADQLLKYLSSKEPFIKR